ncbi:MerR family transcriptional regulator [Streptomyces sp. NPDC091377]|uniref:helix-turn-helix domain-containing protein n=1 Tax=Streptomyces sp. NPDC091377 TaxID=3365995 RepID=UPI00381E2285
MDDPHGVSIGEAAALYDLAPSTLRWWESRQVLPDPPRTNGRRVYTETDLRRIGLAYLCCVTGSMPLDQASVVVTGSRNREWQGTVRRHAREIEERIRRLQSARAYLLHLLRCPDDDIVTQCPDLDGELASHTPRGRVAAPDLVAAARSALRDGKTGGRRDEMNPADVSARCAVCSGRFTPSARGRHRTYCSAACRQRQYRRKADSRSAPDAFTPPPDGGSARRPAVT